MNIRLFITGGTLNKEYDPVKQNLYIKETHLPEMLQKSRCRLDVKVEKLIFMDSLDMTMDERLYIAENCKRVKEDQIVITHGTDTIVETATVLEAHVKEKTIVLTGAMIPYTIDSSCSLFNVGSALAFVQTLPKGVYVSMDGRYFKPDEVKKDKQTGEFEETSNS